MNRSNAVFDRLVSQVQSAGKTDASVLIGEVGTGKRQAAASVHRCSCRDPEEFVLNCMGMDDATFCMDLFGIMGSDGQLLHRGAASIADEGVALSPCGNRVAQGLSNSISSFFRGRSITPCGSHVEQEDECTPDHIIVGSLKYEVRTGRVE